MAELLGGGMRLSQAFLSSVPGASPQAPGPLPSPGVGQLSLLSRTQRRVSHLTSIEKGSLHQWSPLPASCLGASPAVDDPAWPTAGEINSQRFPCREKSSNPSSSC